MTTLETPLQANARIESLRPKRLHRKKKKIIPIVHHDRLVVFLHFHKSGGSSIIKYLTKQLGMIGTASIPQPWSLNGTKMKGKDLILKRGSDNGLRIRSIHPGISRAGNPEFWKSSFYRQGIDFVSLEYNFVTPEQFMNSLSHVARTFTIIRDPWSRYLSTYERELVLLCQRKQKERLISPSTRACYGNNTLKDWFGNVVSPRKGRWGGILQFNFYVRFLNGINDQPKVNVTTEHLEIAKKILAGFDLVMLLEYPDELKLQKLDHFFGNQTDVANQKMPSVSNNYLKRDTMYETMHTESMKMKQLFDEHNRFDLELYDFVKNELLATQPSTTSTLNITNHNSFARAKIEINERAAFFTSFENMYISILISCSIIAVYTKRQTIRLSLLVLVTVLFLFLINLQQQKDRFSFG